MTEFTLSLRSALRLAKSAGLLTMARAAGAQPLPAIAKGTTLTVSTWGGITSDGIRDYVAP